MPNTTRTFKAAWFTKAAYKAGISDDDLCKALREIRDRAELVAFRKLAGEYENLSARQIDALLDDGALTEICHDNKAKA
jgi:hypothetical protein